MTRSELIAELKASLNDAAARFTTPADADFIRHLDVASRAVASSRTRTISASLTLVADEHHYSAPADLIAPKFSRWGEEFKTRYNFWDACYPKDMPKLSVVELSGARKLRLDPAPTAAQIGWYGSTYPYFYYAAHVLSDTPGATTLQDADKGLLLLRAQAEAMKELALRNVGKPVQMRDGLSYGPKNGTPAALYDQLMREFEKAA